jgi:hypothetical protein
MRLVNFETTIEDMIEELVNKESAGQEHWRSSEREWEIEGELAEWMFKKWLEER